MNQYYSFLIVNHPTQIDIYHMGLPVGKIVDGKFEPHHITVGNDKRQVHMGDFPKSPFEDFMDLNDDIMVAIKEFFITARPENKNKDEEYKEYIRLKEKFGNS